MKIDRSKGKRTSAEAPQEAKVLIDKLKGCQDKTTLLATIKSIKTWKFGKCELYHWVDVLDIFDRILLEATEKASPDSWIIACDDPNKNLLQECVLHILRFTTMLVEHSFSRHLYNSVEHLINLLTSSDLVLVLEVLHLLYMFSKRSNFLTRMATPLRTLLNERLTYLAESWGGKEAGFGLADCCQDLPLSSYPSSATSVHLEFTNFEASDENVIGRNKSEPTILHLDSVHTYGTTAGQTMDNAIHVYSVPVSKRLLLFVHLRLAINFPQWETRLLCVQARLQALSVLIYANGISDNIYQLLYRGFMEELVNVLELEELSLTEIKAAALRTLTSIIHLDRAQNFPKYDAYFKFPNRIIDVTEAGSYHGFLPMMVRSCITSLTSHTGKCAKLHSFPLPLATALFSFVYHLASYELGGEALVNCGMLESLLKVINWNTTDPEHITFVTRAVRVIDLITNMEMQSFQTHNGLINFINRLEVEVNECKKEQPYEIRPDETNISPQDDNDGNEENAASPMDTDSNNDRTEESGGASGSFVNKYAVPASEFECTGHVCLPQRAALLKSMLNFLKKAIQDQAFSDNIRHIMETSLPISLKHIISNAEYYGSSLFLQSTDVVTVYVFQEPSLLSSLQDSGLTEVMLDAILVKEIPPTREVISSMPNVFSALSLNARGLNAFVKRKPFHRMFKVLVTPEYLPPMRRRRGAETLGDTAVNLGNAMDELMRHQPSLKTEAISALVELLQELCSMGTDTGYSCWKPQANSRQSTTNNSNRSGAPEGGSSEDDDDDEEENLVATVERIESNSRSSNGREDVAPSTSETSAVPEEKTAIPLVDYIFNVMKFVDAILSNNSTDDHCREFVSQKGLKPLMEVFSIPNLPLDFPNSPACHAASCVCKSIINLSNEVMVLNEGMACLDRLLTRLEPLNHSLREPGSSVLLHELANAGIPFEAVGNPHETPILNAMTSAHAYIMMFIHVSRTGQNDIRQMTIAFWGSREGVRILKQLSKLYWSLVWESTVLLALCSADYEPGPNDFARADLDKIFPPGTKKEHEVSLKEAREDANSDSALLSASPVASVSFEPNELMEVDNDSIGADANVLEICEGQNVSKSESKTTKLFSNYAKPLRPILSSSSRLGRALAELFGLLVKLSVGSPLRQRRGHHNMPAIAGFVSPGACEVAKALSELLTDGLDWEPTSMSPVPKLTFKICAVGFSAPLLFDEKKFPYHLMLKKFLDASGLRSLFNVFYWALSEGADEGQAIEGQLSQKQVEFLEAWLVLVEKFVNPKSILETPHVLPTKAPGTQKPSVHFDPSRFISHVHKLAFEAVLYLWNHKSMSSLGAKGAEYMLGILCHILRHKHENKISSEDGQSTPRTEVNIQTRTSQPVFVDVPSRSGRESSSEIFERFHRRMNLIPRTQSQGTVSNTAEVNVEVAEQPSRAQPSSASVPSIAAETTTATEPSSVAEVSTNQTNEQISPIAPLPGSDAQSEVNTTNNSSLTEVLPVISSAATPSNPTMDNVDPSRRAFVISRGLAIAAASTIPVPTDSPIQPPINTNENGNELVRVNVSDDEASEHDAATENRERVMAAQFFGIEIGHLDQLCDMGFSLERCIQALLCTNNVMQATDHLLSDNGGLLPREPREPREPRVPVRRPHFRASVSWDSANEDPVLRTIAASIAEQNKISNLGLASKGPRQSNDPMEKLDSLRSEDIDKLTETILEKCVSMIDNLPETVFKVCEVLVSVGHRRGKDWTKESLTLLVQEIVLGIYLVNGVLTEATKNNSFEDLCTHSVSCSLYIRLHLFGLMFEEAQSVCARLIEEMDVINKGIKLLTELHAFMQRVYFDNPEIEIKTPRWLAPLVLLFDLYEKSSVASKRRSLLAKETDHYWKWFDINSGKWCSYSIPNNQTIDNAFWSGETSVRITAGRRRYVINFHSMIQLNEETSNRRPITLWLKNSPEDGNKNTRYLEALLRSIERWTKKMHSAITHSNPGITATEDVAPPPTGNNLSDEPGVPTDLTKLKKGTTTKEINTSDKMEVDKDVDNKDQPNELKGLTNDQTIDLIIASVGFMRSVLPETLHAVMRLCLRLTRDFEYAVMFNRLGGVHSLLTLTEESAFPGFLPLANLLIRHAMEDPSCLRYAMEKMIRGKALSTGASTCKELHYLLRVLAPVACRAPAIFAEVAKEVLRVDINFVTRRGLTVDDDQRLIVKPTNCKTEFHKGSMGESAKKVIHELLMALPTHMPFDDEDVGNITTPPSGKENVNPYAEAPCPARRSRRAPPRRIVLEDDIDEEVLEHMDTDLPAKQSADKEIQKMEKKDQPRKKYIIPKFAIFQLLAESVHSYSFSSKVIAEFTYAAGSAPNIQEDTTALAYLLDTSLASHMYSGMKDCMKVVQDLISGMAGCNHMHDVQTIVVSEVKSALQRVVSLRESLDKHGRITALSTLIAQMIEACPANQPVHLPGPKPAPLSLNPVLKLILKKGLMVDLTRIPHHLDLTSEELCGTINSLLSTLEAISRIVNQPVPINPNRSNVKSKPEVNTQDSVLTQDTSNSAGTRAQGEETVEDADNTEHDISAEAESLDPTSESHNQVSRGTFDSSREAFEEAFTSIRNHLVGVARGDPSSEDHDDLIGDSQNSRMDTEQDEEANDSSDSDSEASVEGEEDGEEEDDDDEEEEDDDDDDDEEELIAAHFREMSESDQAYLTQSFDEGFIRFPGLDRHEDIYMVQYSENDHPHNTLITSHGNYNFNLGVFEDSSNEINNAGLRISHPLLISPVNEPPVTAGLTRQRSARQRRYQYVQYINPRHAHPPAILQRLLGPTTAHEVMQLTTGQPLPSSLRDTRFVVQMNDPAIDLTTREGPRVIDALANYTALHWWCEESKALDGESMHDCVVGVKREIVQVILADRDVIFKGRNTRRAEEAEANKKKRDAHQENLLGRMTDLPIELRNVMAGRANQRIPPVEPDENDEDDDSEGDFLDLPNLDDPSRQAVSLDVEIGRLDIDLQPGQIDVESVEQQVGPRQDESHENDDSDSDSDNSTDHPRVDSEDQLNNCAALNDNESDISDLNLGEAPGQPADENDHPQSVEMEAPLPVRQEVVETDPEADMEALGRFLRSDFHPLVSRHGVYDLEPVQIGRFFVRRYPTLLECFHRTQPDAPRRSQPSIIPCSGGVWDFRAVIHQIHDFQEFREAALEAGTADISQLVHDSLPREGLDVGMLERFLHMDRLSTRTGLEFLLNRETNNDNAGEVVETEVSTTERPLTLVSGEAQASEVPLAVSVAENALSEPAEPVPGPSGLQSDDFRNILGDMEVPEGVDPSFLAALPEDMRQEVIAEHLRQQRGRRSQTPITTAEALGPLTVSDVSPEFLAALPQSIQEELLLQQRLEQQRRVAVASNPNDPVDTEAFFRNLQPSLRQSILADMEESQIAVLPPELAAEAQNLRREWEVRNRQVLQDRFLHHNTSLPNPANAAAFSSILRNSGLVAGMRHMTQRHNRGLGWRQFSTNMGQGTSANNHPNVLGAGSRVKGKQLVDHETLCCILIILYVEDPKINNGRLHRVLRNLSYHAGTRNWIIKALLSVLEKGNDCTTPLLQRSSSEPVISSYSGLIFSQKEIEANEDQLQTVNPSWLNVTLESGMGCRANVFHIQKIATSGKKSGADQRKISIHPQAVPSMCKNTMDMLCNLAKSFPCHFLPGKLKATVEWTNDAAKIMNTDNESKKQSTSSSSKSKVQTDGQDGFFDLLLKLDSATSSKKGKCLAKVQSSLSQDQLAAPTTFDESHFGKLILMLGFPYIHRSTLLTDKLLRILAMISLGIPDTNGYGRKVVLEESDQTDYIQIDECHLRLIVDAITSKSCSEDGLEEATALLLNMSFGPPSTRDKILKVLQEGVRYLGIHVCRNISWLMAELDSFNSTNKDTKEGPDEQNTSSSELEPVDKRIKGTVLDRFTKENVIINTKSRAKASSELQLKSMPTLTSKSSNQAFFLRLLKVIINLREAIRVAIKKHKQKETSNIGGPIMSSTSINGAAAENTPSCQGQTSVSRPTPPTAREDQPMDVDQDNTDTSGLDPPEQMAVDTLIDLSTTKFVDKCVGSEEKGADKPVLDADKLLPRLSTLLDLNVLWDTLSNCLSKLGHTPDHHAVLVLQPAVEAFFLVHASSIDKDDKKINVRESREAQLAHLHLELPPVSPIASNDTSNTTGSDITNEHQLSGADQSQAGQELSEDAKYFVKFAETHRTVLNQILRQSTSHLADGPFAVLVDHTRVLDFDVKRRYFRTELERLDEGVRREDLAVHVRRSAVFEDSFRELQRRTAEDWKNRFYIVFEGEEGQDAGGLLREWYMIISREIFNPMYALFTISPGDRVTYMINPSSHCNPNHLFYFKFVGRVIAKAIYDNKLLECYFTRSFYKHILGKHVKHVDMESEDYSFYQGLAFLMDNNVSELGYDLTFSTEVQEFGVTEVRDLITNGRNIPVTEENKMEYIRLVCQMKMTGAIRKQLNAFLEGFYDIIPKRLISIFSEQELELLVSGLPNIDIEDLKANTEYHKYQPNSLQIQWFWRALRSFDQADRAKFLQFVTGTSKVPLQGFGALEGMNGVQKFQIHRDDRSTDRLPSAHTCFNQLDLPAYETYDKLRNYMLKAVHECSEGFGFA